MKKERENICLDCIHLSVCSLRDAFQSAQKAVDECVVSEPMTQDDGRVLMKTGYIRDIEWIKPITLQCHYYIRKGEPIVR